MVPGLADANEKLHGLNESVSIVAFKGLRGMTKVGQHGRFDALKMVQSPIWVEHLSMDYLAGQIGPQMREVTFREAVAEAMSRNASGRIMFLGEEVAYTPCLQSLQRYV